MFQSDVTYALVSDLWSWVFGLGLQQLGLSVCLALAFGPLGSQDFGISHPR